VRLDNRAAPPRRQLRAPGRVRAAYDPARLFRFPQAIG